MTEEKIKVFRPIHYLGSKLRLLDFIEETLNEIGNKNGGVCDLFAGSGSVSFQLSYSRPIVAVDIQEYSRVICSAILNKPLVPKEYLNEFLKNCEYSNHSKKLFNAIKPLIDFEQNAINNAIEKIELESLCDIIENGSLISYQVSNQFSGNNKLLEKIKLVLKNFETSKVSDKDSLSIRYFGGIYFSYEQTYAIDSILHQIELAHNDYKDLFKAALLSTISEAVNTVGKQFAQPIRPRNSKGLIKSTLGKAVNKDRKLDVFKSYVEWLNKYLSIPIPNHTNIIVKNDFLDALDNLPDNIEFIYADPPYTRDHYSRFYHVLETISLRDLPEISTMVNKGETKLSRGLYREERHQSPFCIRSQAPIAFENMFKKISSKGLKLLLSYSPYDDTKESHPRVVKMDFLIKLAEKYFEFVEVKYVDGFTHSKLNHSNRHLSASSNAEVLIICR
jgi:adenine-specific DNA methylase